MIEKSADINDINDNMRFACNMIKGQKQVERSLQGRGFIYVKIVEMVPVVV